MRCRIVALLARLALVPLALAPGLPGCGYQLVRYEEEGRELGRVAVRTPRNDSFEPGIERMVADALRREFLRRGALELVDDADSADLVVSGRVLPIRAVGRSFSSVVLALEYELTLELELQATRRDGSEVAIGRRALFETERYLASADVEATRKNRQEALRRLSQVLAGRVHDSLVEVIAP